MMDIKKSLAKRVIPLEASAIREMFKLMGQADVISFAGGIPSPEVYPTDTLAKISENILATNGQFKLISAMQALPTEVLSLLMNME